MRRVITLLACCTALVAFVGCAQCQSPYDYCYPAHGGICACDGYRCARVGSFGHGTSPAVDHDADDDVVDPDEETIELPAPE